MTDDFEVMGITVKANPAVPDDHIEFRDGETGELRGILGPLGLVAIHPTGEAPYWPGRPPPWRQQQ